jgi:quercetin dioxygenase-like cupin family protein
MPSTTTNDAVIDLTTAVDAVLDEARRATSGRAGRTLPPGAGAPLKQTLLALTQGTQLADHASPGPSSLHVLAGQVRLTAEGDPLDLATGAYTQIPPVRHGVEALADAVVLITVAQAQPQP